MTRVGLDVGFTTGGVISWTVFADTNRYAGMLAGTYGGPTAEVSVAAGLGANVLVGGSRRTVALQPLSVQGQIGLDIGAGITHWSCIPRHKRWAASGGGPDSEVRITGRQSHVRTSKSKRQPIYSAWLWFRSPHDKGAEK